MCLITKFVFKLLSIVHPFLNDFSHSTIDINFPEYQYIADHLTERECHKLVAALHFHTFELPNDIEAAERRLPDDATCIDLLLYWNSTPREGKGQTHIEVCRRLNEIGRQDLAQWLSKTVFHEITKDLKVDLAATEDEHEVLSLPNITDEHTDTKVLDEAAWWTIDSILSILIVFGLITIFIGSCFLCFLCCTRTKEKHKGYKKVPLNDN